MCHYQSNNSSYLIVLEGLVTFTFTSYTYFYFNFYNENYENIKFCGRVVVKSFGDALRI